MKKCFGLMVMAFALISFCLSGCHRNYEVVHVRPAEDTLSRDDVEKVEDQAWDEEPLLDIPPAPQEKDFTNAGAQARKEYDDFLHVR